jgi:hypothetical protein
MTDSTPADSIVALNQILDEVLELILEVKQADRKVLPSHELHGELDRLFADLLSWRTLLADQDLALGVNPLSFISSAAGRTQVILWSGNPTDDEVSLLVGAHLLRLESHLSSLLDDTSDETSAGAFSEIRRGVVTHREALALFGAPEG